MTRPLLRRQATIKWGGLAFVLLAIALSVAASFRVAAVAQSTPPVPQVVLVYPYIPNYRLFRDGAELATREVNATGGVGSFRLVTQMIAQENVNPPVRLETAVARSLVHAANIAKTDNLLAVVGYGLADGALSAGSVYDRAGIPFLATHAKSVVLTSLGFQQVFALQCNYADDTRVLARYARKTGLKRFVVLSQDSVSGAELSRTFIRFASERGATILYNAELGTHFPTTERLLLYLLDNPSFAASEIDAFFVASNSHDVNIDLIIRARQLGLNMPILGSAEFLAGDIESRLGPSLMKGLTVPSTYAGVSTEPQAAAFVDAFEASYKTKPDLYSAIGYDGIKLLAHAVQGAGKTDRHLIADTLRGLRFRSPFVGVTGPMNFDNLGRVTNRPMYVFRHDGVRFRKVATFDHSCAADPPASDEVPELGDEMKESTP